MTEQEAQRQLKRARKMHEAAQVYRESADSVDRDATDLEIEALTFLDENWAEEHTG